jgi:hypothetical protein
MEQPDSVTPEYPKNRIKNIIYNMIDILGLIHCLADNIKAFEAFDFGH